MDGNDTMTQSTICDEISPKVSKESVPVEVELFEIWKKKQIAENKKRCSTAVRDGDGVFGGLKVLEGLLFYLYP